MKKIKVFLADLVHNQHIYNYGVPLNIGYVAARVSEKVGNAVDMRLFKFPDVLIKSLKEMPDILALSNYDWNVNLNKAIIAMARKRKPDILIVMGGPNIRKSKEGIRQFLLSSPDVDIYIVNEGEDGFCGLLESILKAWPCNIQRTIIEKRIQILNNAYLSNDNSLILGESSRTSLVDPIPYPSPWLSGMLDSYLHSSPFFLDPLIETNRGCPYQCAYCTWGTFEDRQVRKFDLDTVVEELRYIFKRSIYSFRLMIADANFGIFERDVFIAEEIRRLSDRYRAKVIGIYIALSQNFTRNIEIANILREYCIPVFAMQTFNNEVLENVGRKNIKVNKIGHFLHAVSERGLKVTTDLLIGLPGETKKSHIASVRQAYDIGFYKSQIGPIRLLAGSRMEEDDFQKKYEIEPGFRVIPQAYGEYEGVRVIEFEKCVIKTSTMSREDFFSLRLFGAYLFLVFNLEFGRPLIDLSNQYGLHPIDLILAATKNSQKKNSPALVEEINFYNGQAMTEWFMNETEANDYYLKDEVFKRIMEEGFAKLNYDFAAKLVINPTLRNAFMIDLANTIKDTLPCIKTSVVDDVARFSVERIYTLPIPEAQNKIQLSLDAAKELQHYLANVHVLNYKIASPVGVEFRNDTKKIEILRERIEHPGSSGELSSVVQEMLHVDNKSFIREEAYLV